MKIIPFEIIFPEDLGHKHNWELTKAVTNNFWGISMVSVLIRKRWEASGNSLLTLFLYPFYKSEQNPGCEHKWRMDQPKYQHFCKLDIMKKVKSTIILGPNSIRCKSQICNCSFLHLAVTDRAADISAAIRWPLSSAFLHLCFSQQ